MEYVYNDKLWEIVDNINEISGIKDPKMVMKFYKRKQKEIKKLNEEKIQVA